MNKFICKKANDSGKDYKVLRELSQIKDALGGGWDCKNRLVSRIAELNDNIEAGRHASSSISDRLFDMRKEDVYRRALQYGGVVGGAGIGAWLDRRNRLRGLLIGGLVGGVVTNTGKALYDLSRL